MSTSPFRGVSRGESPSDAPELSRQVLTGSALAVTAALVLVVGAALDLELDAVALLGVTLGAVVALAPGATPPARLVAFATGVVASLMGYLFRAQFMPDTSGGRAVVVLVTVALCVGVVALSLGRLPLWTVLLGAGAFAGSYEAAFAAAPPRVLETFPTALTALLLCSAAGWLVASLTAPRADAPAHTGRVPGMRRASRTERDSQTETDHETDHETDSQTQMTESAR